MHSLGRAVYFAFYSLDIGLTDCIGSFMRMAYIVPEVNTLAANITLCHLDTSSIPAYHASYFVDNSDILPEIYGKSK